MHIIIPCFLKWIWRLFLPDSSPLSPEPSPEPTARQRLAESIGLDLSYRTIWGHIQEASPTAEAAIVRSLTGRDFPVYDEAAARAYLAEAAARPSPLFESSTLVEPIDTPLAGLAERLTQAESGSPISLRIDWEDGTSTHLECPAPFNAATLAPIVRPGYHRVSVETNSRRADLRWILCPRRCYVPPAGEHRNGLNCFLPALRSENNWGCGDFTDLVQFATRLREHSSFDFIALNPLHAIHNRRPYNTSPYLPLSIFTHNFLYLDIRVMPEFQISAAARRWYASASVQKQLRDLRASHLVEYESVARLKTFFLLLLYREYCRQNPDPAEGELARYRRERGHWLESYATYMAFDRHFHKLNPEAWHWHHWPEAYQNPASPETQALQQRIARSIGFHCWLEMRIEQQLAQAHAKLRELGYSIGLYQDLALATDRVGADYWANQQLFAPRVRVGSPPDDFNENGQDWGFPALHPRRHRDSGYEYFIESIHCAARHAGAIRLDHVMRLARLYWIPDQVSARDGAYVRDFFRDLLHILALESSRRELIVVGEDLGTVPDYFRTALDDAGILSYRLILFERDGPGFRNAQGYPQQAIASFTTHDLPTFDGWLKGTDLEARQAAGQMQAAELPAAQAQRGEAVTALRNAFSIAEFDANPDSFFSALCKFLHLTPSSLRLLNLEELLGETEQQNLPGTTSEAPNWQRRVALSTESLFNDPALLRRLSIWNQSLSDTFPKIEVTR